MLLSIFEKKNLKNITLIAFLLLHIFCGCNNSNNKKGSKVAVIDSGSNTLVNLSAGNSLPQLLCQNWENKEDVDDGILNYISGSNADLEIPFHSYCFFEDGLMVQNPRDNLKMGKWTLDEKTKLIHLIFDDGIQKNIGLNGIGVKSLLLKTGKEKPVKYVADGKKHITLLDDPFYPANNKWRIKSAHSETTGELKSRIIQCVLFYNKFLQDNADRRANRISFYGLPTCFKWYKGGISITNKDKMGQKWIDCFYNKEQAIQGQQMLENIIEKKYKWNRNEPNWVHQSADVLLQIADSLK